MILNNFEIKRYDFNPHLFNDFQNSHTAKDLWPIVYILSDGYTKEAYVGETTDTYARLTNHLKSDAKKKLSVVHLISSEKFNKSATLDIESNLIKYISGDGQYKLMNANLGLANHNYYQKKEVYWDIFTSIWDKLRAEGITKHSLRHINNSDLFKYSPYKSLNQEQREGLLVILRSLLNNTYKNVVVEGGAGTGKTILATFLFKLLKSTSDEFDFREFGEDEVEILEIVLALRKRYPNPRMALVVPMASFRETLKKVFKNVKDLTASMVIGPADLANEKYDIVLVDESHRLRRRVNLGSYFHPFDVVCEKLSFDKHTCSELDWVVKQSGKAILFYDENQSIKPSDVQRSAFDKLKASKSTKIEYLKSQFRVKGGNGYVAYIDKLLQCEINSGDKIFNSKEYEFVLFSSIKDMVEQIKLRDKESGLARLIAGFSWPWISRQEGIDFDIEIDGTSLKWNSVAKDFINSPNALNEVGCIHTTQGYDLNYSGIIFGNEITYDKQTNEIVILKENYYDKAGKASISDPAELKDFIINIYKTIMLRGIKGTYVYACDKNLREYLSKHIENYQTEVPKAIINSVDAIPYVNAVPVYDLKAAASNFSALQSVKIDDHDWVVIPARYKASKDLFACTVVGESMNKVIPNGSMCLFREYSGGSRNGKIVLVEHTSIQDPDTGSSYTVKEYSSTKNIANDEWSHASINLKPLSYDSSYEDIVLSEDEVSYLQVIGIFECVL
jgi:uncharacterized protein